MMQVLVEEQLSEKVPCDKWCPSRLGVRTSFFLINDLLDNLNSKARMFADDCIVYREIKSNQDQLFPPREF